MNALGSCVRTGVIQSRNLKHTVIKPGPVGALGGPGPSGDSGPGPKIPASPSRRGRAGASRGCPSSARRDLRGWRRPGSRTRRSRTLHVELQPRALPAPSWRCHGRRDARAAGPSDRRPLATRKVPSSESPGPARRPPAAGPVTVPEAPPYAQLESHGYPTAGPASRVVDPIYIIFR